MMYCARFALLALAFLPSSDSLRFAPRQGASLTRTFQIERELAGGDLEVVMDGLEVPPEFLPVLELEIEDTDRVVFTDHYRKVEAGRVTELARTFDEIEYESQERQSMSESTQAADSESEGDSRASSPLSGLTVSFLWDAEGEESGRSFEDESTDPDERALLDGLDATVDFRGFLPEGEVARGEEWEVDASVLATVLHPGGNLGLVWEGDMAEENSSAPIENIFEGTLQCKLTSRNDQNGVSFATITIEGEFTQVVVLASDLSRVPGFDGDATETHSTEYVIEGELLWNLDGGHLQSLEIEAEVEVETSIVKDPGQAGPELETTVYVSGTETWTVDVSSAE